MARKVKDSEYWEEFGKRMGRKVGEAKIYHCNCIAGISSLGLLLLLIGLYWLAKDMGWIQPQVSTWAVIFIIVGAYWFIKSLFRRSI